MDWTLWAGFVVASLIVGLLPGPGVTSIVGYALTRGLRTALASVFGATAGNAIAMAFSLVGVGVLIEQYPAAFAMLKWVGAAYLVAIGLYAIVTARTADEDDGSGPKTIRPATAFWGTFAITAVNPKTIIFFVAFTPQFMSPNLDYWTQAGVLLADLLRRRDAQRRLLCGRGELGRRLPQGAERSPLVAARRRRRARSRPGIATATMNALRLTGARAFRNGQSASLSGPIV